MYRRFLNNGDYLGIITKDALSQITRNDNDKFGKAEEAAEASIVDYLSDKYEIERELLVGKMILDYDRRITYPVGAHFYLDGKIYNVIKSINGYKAPSDIKYWELVEDTTVIDKDKIASYSQLSTFQPDDYVSFNDKVYKCINGNGYDFSNIRIPGIEAWVPIEIYDWKNIPYNLWEVVRYNNKFFALISTENYDPLVNPIESKNWGLIGDYDNSLDTYKTDNTEFVVYNNKVYYPVINVNADKPVENVNITEKDPRNSNIKKHMLQLSLYELHKLISPNNVSAIRVTDYDHSIQWLKDASALRLNPGIPRKIDEEDKVPITDWALATFQKSYDPEKNPFLW